MEIEIRQCFISMTCIHLHKQCMVFTGVAVLLSEFSTSFLSFDTPGYYRLTVSKKPKNCFIGAFLSALVFCKLPQPILGFIFCNVHFLPRVRRVASPCKVLQFSSVVALGHSCIILFRPWEYQCICVCDRKAN